MKSLFIFLLIFFNLAVSCSKSSFEPNGAQTKSKPTEPKPETKPQAETKPVDTFTEKKLVPTVYYLQLINIEKKKCLKSESKTFYTTKKAPLATVCAEDYNKCRLQGSCVIYDSKKSISVGYSSTVKSNDYWFLFDRNKCPFGLGHAGACVDPYFSIAADTKYWKSGDVIFVPEVKGLILPNKEIHSGFFTVRDTGTRIKGPHRFDFHIGYSTNNNQENPFIQLKLNDKNTRLNYRLATQSERESVLKEREYPSVIKSSLN